MLFLALVAGGIAFVAALDLPPLDRLDQRLDVPPPWDVFIQPLGLASLGCFLAVLLPWLASFLRLQVLGWQVWWVKGFEGTGWPQRFLRECRDAIPRPRDRNNPVLLSQQIRGHRDALRRIITRRWRVAFLLSLLPCFFGLVAGVRSLHHADAAQDYLQHFTLLLIGSAETLALAGLIYLGIHQPWKGVQAGLVAAGERALAPKGRPQAGPSATASYSPGEQRGQGPEFEEDVL
jgi:hypothetical protein